RRSPGSRRTTCGCPSTPAPWAPPPPIRACVPRAPRERPPQASPRERERAPALPPSPRGHSSRRVPTGRSGLAGALDALEQLGRVPDLRVRRFLAVRQVHRPVLPVQRAHEQLDAAVPKPGLVLLERGCGIRRERLSRLETSRRGCRIVEIRPVWSVPDELRLERTVDHGLRDLEVSGTPVEIRHPQA